MKLNKVSLKSPTAWMGVIIFLCTLIILRRLWTMGIRIAPDTPSYIWAADALQAGHIHPFRTPVYPAVIVLLRSIFGDIWPQAMVAAQYIAFILSGVLLYDIARKYLKKDACALAVCAMYLLWPGTAYYVTDLLTETFGVSGVVTLMWLLLKSQDRCRGRIYTTMAFATLLALILMRPIFLCLLPVPVIYYPALWKIKKMTARELLMPTCAMLVVLGGVGFYRHAMRINFGMQSLSTVTNANNYHLVRAAGVLDPEACPDTLMRELMEGFIADNPSHYNNLNEEYFKIENLGKPASFEQTINASIKRKPAQVAAYLYHRALNVAEFPYLSTPPDTFFTLFTPNFASYFILMLLVLGALSKQWWSTRLIPTEGLLLYLITASVTLTAVMGAQFEWNRLALPGVPAFLLLVGKFCTMFSKNGNAF